jgi:hypothetical protein
MLVCSLDKMNHPVNDGNFSPHQLKSFAQHTLETTVIFVDIIDICTQMGDAEFRISVLRFKHCDGLYTKCKLLQASTGLLKQVGAEADPTQCGACLGALRGARFPHFSPEHRP